MVPGDGGAEHHLARVLKRHPLQCPVAFVGGTRSVELRQVGLAATRRLAHGRVSMVDGTHLFPFEQPAQTAAEVLRCIGTFYARHGMLDKALRDKIDNGWVTLAREAVAGNVPATPPSSGGAP